MREPSFEPAREQAQSQLQWQQFTTTGSIYDYLDYKSQLNGDLRKETDADSHHRAGPAPGEGWRSGSDTNAVDP